MAYNEINEPVILLVKQGSKFVPAAGLQPGYGPHASLDAARTALTSVFNGSLTAVPQGYTFCVIESGIPVEYWFTKSGTWEVEKKCKATTSSSPSTPTENPLKNLTIFIDADGTLKYSDGNSVKPVGKVNQPTDLTKIKLAIREGILYISYDGSTPTTVIGSVGEGGPGVEINTQLRFTSSGILQVSYDGGLTWDENGIIGAGYQGRRIDENTFKDLLMKYLKFKVEDGLLNVSYSCGDDGTWTRLVKDCMCAPGASPDPATQSEWYKVTVNVTDIDGNKLSGASVYLDGELIAGQSTYVKPGTYRVVVERPGYYTSAERTVNVQGDNVEISVALIKDETVGVATLTVVVRDYDTSEILTESDIAVTITGDGRVGTTSLTVPSGTECVVTYSGVPGSGYGSGRFRVPVPSDMEFPIDVKREEQGEPTEDTYTLHLGFREGVTPDTTLNPNSGCQITRRIYAARHNALSADEDIDVISAYNYETGDVLSFTVSDLSPETIAQAVPGYYDHVKNITITIPAVTKEQLTDGYIYNIVLIGQDREGHTVTSQPKGIYFQGFWQYFIERTYQDFPIDASTGGTIYLSTDAYCRAHEDCPGDHDTMYPCTLIFPEGASYDGRQVLGTQNMYMHGTYREYWLYPDYQSETPDSRLINGRWIYHINVDAPETISGAEYDSSTHKYLVPFVVKIGNFANPRNPSQWISVPAADKIEKTLWIESGKVGDYSLTANYDYLTAYGDEPAGTYYNTKFPRSHGSSYTFTINSELTENSDWRHNGAAEVIFKLKYGNTVLHTVTVPVLELGGNQKISYQSPVEQLDLLSTDGYITGISIITGRNLTKSQVQYRIDYGYLFLVDREYTIEVTQVASNKTLTLNWNLVSPVFNPGTILFNKQFAPNADGGVLYFGIVNPDGGPEYQASDFHIVMDGEGNSLDPRENAEDITIEDVNAIPGNNTGITGYSWFRCDLAHRAYPLTIRTYTSGVYTFSWFKVTYPAVPNPGDSNRMIRLVTDDEAQDFWAYQESR